MALSIITLKQARTKRDEAKAMLNDGLDPTSEKQLAKNFPSNNTAFENIAREWFAKFSVDWSNSHATRVIRGLERDIFPWLGNRQIDTITAPQVLQMVRRIEHRGALETAHRTLQNCGQVFRYAVATGRAERDPTRDLRGAIPPAKKKHHASITEPKEVAKLLRAIDGYQGAFVTRCALKLSALLFVRPGELRHMEWVEVNAEDKEWRIPANKMKAKEKHIVPLSTQALAILEELRPLTGSFKYVCVGAVSNLRPMSENTVNLALRRLGYSNDEMTAHGFRSMASTRASAYKKHQIN